MNSNTLCFCAFWTCWRRWWWRVKSWKKGTRRWTRFEREGRRSRDRFDASVPVQPIGREVASNIKVLYICTIWSRASFLTSLVLKLSLYLVFLHTCNEQPLSIHRCAHNSIYARVQAHGDAHMSDKTFRCTYGKLHVQYTRTQRGSCQPTAYVKRTGSLSTKRHVSKCNLPEQAMYFAPAWSIELPGSCHRTAETLCIPSTALA